MRIRFFISGIVIATLFLCCETNVFNCMENDKEYTVWTHIRAFMLDGTETDLILCDYDDLCTMPISVRAVVARLAAFSPDYIWDEDMKQQLAHALGDFRSLEEAQKDLMEIWGKDYTPVEKPVSLTIKRSGKLLFFSYGFIYGQDRVRDEFKISGKEELKWINRHVGRR